MITNLTIDGKPWRQCTLDIAVLNKKVAIRLNGEYHHVSGNRQNKDEYQAIALEQAGWVVVDFNNRTMPNLFKSKKNEQTVKLAEEEILKYLGKVSSM